MKTYLLNIPNELKNFSQKKDVVALLCSKSWEVFNDEENKQILIFQKNGTLLVSTNGDVINSTWQFIPANKSIIISAEGKTTMLNPVFVDGVVLAMGKSGTQECLFMIDETRTDVMPNRTFGELVDYFQKALENSHEYVANQQTKIVEQKKQIICEHQTEIIAAVAIKRKKCKLRLYIYIIAFLVSLIMLIMLPDAIEWTGLTCVISVTVIAIVVDKLFNVNEDVKAEIVEKYMPK